MITKLIYCVQQRPRFIGGDLGEPLPVLGQATGHIRDIRELGGAGWRGEEQSKAGGGGSSGVLEGRKVTEGAEWRVGK